MTVTIFGSRLFIVRLAANSVASQASATERLVVSFRAGDVEVEPHLFASLKRRTATKMYALARIDAIHKPSNTGTTMGYRNARSVSISLTFIALALTRLEFIPSAY